MIPVCMRESVTFKDSDEIVWTFRPKTGALESDYMATGTKAQAEFDAGNAEAGIACHKEFFDRIVLGWSEQGTRMPKQDGKPSAIFNAEERMQVLEMWGKANSLTAEEKKS